MQRVIADVSPPLVAKYSPVSKRVLSQISAEESNASGHATPLARPACPSVKFSLAPTSELHVVLHVRIDGL